MYLTHVSSILEIQKILNNFGINWSYTVSYLDNMMSLKDLRQLH